MKTEKEIRHICGDIIDSESVNSKYKQAVFEGAVLGYTQCQEDMKKELYEFGKLVLDTFHSEGKTHSGEARLARIKYHEWFNEL